MKLEKSGYAIDKNGDLQNVFNVGKKGYGGKAVEDAVKRGARKLDCFEGYLSKWGEFRLIGILRLKTGITKGITNLI